MTFASLHRGVTYLLAGLGLFSLTLGSELDPPVMLLTFALFLASWFVGPPIYDRPGYSRFWNGIVVGVLVLEVARGMAGAPVLSLGIEFAVVLQISRLFHRRTARDHQHIQALAFLHLIAATILSTGLDYAFAFVGFVVVLPWMLALTHLRSEIEGHYAPEPLRDDAPVPAVVKRVLGSRNIAGPGFLAGTAALAVPLFVVTAAFFLLFPRVGMGFLSFSNDPGRRVAGFGNNIELGGFGVIRDDPTVVLRVLPEDIGEAPPERVFRLRGTSFDHYEEASWTRGFTEPPRAIAQHFAYYPIVRPPTGAPNEEKLRIILDPLDEPVLFLPEGTIALRLPPRVENAIDVARELSLSPGLDVRYEDGDGLELRYTAVLADDARGRFVEPLDADDFALYTQLPEGHERVTALARRIAGGGGDEARAERLLHWLRDSGELSYTLEQPDTRGQDPLHVFLFEAKRGHCEYFSSALAVMARSLGIPARNVTGFLGGEYNPYGRYYAIRQGDAHSWVELYLDGAWVTYDPTPPIRGELPVDDGVLRELRALLDALRTRWSEDVVGYDLRRQVEGLRRLFEWMRRFRSPPQRGVAESGVQVARRTSDHGWLVVPIALLVLLGVAWRWRRAPKARVSRDAREAVRLYRDLERALARAGHTRPPGRTPQEHAARLREAGFAAAPAVEEVTAAYEAARFGRVALGPDAQRRLRAAIRSIPRAGADVRAT